MIKANRKELEKQARNQEMKERIVKAAIDIMNKYGYSYVTVRNVCEEAGITTGKFYRQFENKDMLLVYLSRDGFEVYRKENADKLKKMSSLEQLIDLYRWYVVYFSELGIEFAASYFNANNSYLSDRRTPEFDALEGSQLRSIAYITYQLILEAQKDGFLSAKEDADEIYRELDIITFGVVLEWCLCGGGHDIGEYEEKLIRKSLNTYK